MSSPEHQKEVFQARLNRIRNRGADMPLPEPALAEAGSLPPSRQRKAAPRKKPVSPVPSIWENLAYPLSILGAVLIGMIAVFAARYARFHLQGGTLVGEDADIAMMLDGALAFCVGFVFRSFFRFESQEFITAKTLGIAAMIALMHNLVHWAPGLFTGLFDADYVTATIEMTEPNSILFRGVSFVLIDPEPEEEMIMPTILEIGV